jgi:hypothetical protein
MHPMINTTASRKHLSASLRDKKGIIFGREDGPGEFATRLEHIGGRPLSRAGKFDVGSHSKSATFVLDKQLEGQRKGLI